MLTLAVVHSHHGVVARCRNFSGNMVIDLVGSRYLNLGKYRRAVAVALIYVGMFAHKG